MYRVLGSPVPGPPLVYHPFVIAPPLLEFHNRFLRGPRLLKMFEFVAGFGQDAAEVRKKESLTDKLGNLINRLMSIQYLLERYGGFVIANGGSTFETCRVGDELVHERMNPLALLQSCFEPLENTLWYSVSRGSLRSSNTCQQVQVLVNILGRRTVFVVFVSGSNACSILFLVSR